MKEFLGIVLMTGFSFQARATDQVFLKAPVAPIYETCQLVVIDNGNGGTYQTQDSLCVSRNATKKMEYSAAVETYNRANRITTTDAGTVTKPVQPTYEECKTTDDGSGHLISDYACQSRNQTKQQDYSIQIQAWNMMQENQAQLTQADLAKKQAEAEALMKSQSATEALQKAIAENARASDKSSKASQITAGLSVAFGIAFAVSCSGAVTCQYPLLAASVGFGVMSALNGKQASANDASGYAACQSQNQLSGSSINCGAAPAGYDVAASTPKPSSLVPTIFDSNGNCVSTDKNICNSVIAGLPAGTNIKDITKAASSFAGAYKLNPDGSATLKDGKILKPSDFKDAKSLIAAGYTPEQAAATMAALAKSSAGIPASGLEKAAAELKGDKFNADFSGSLMGGTGGSDSGKNSAGLGSSGALGNKGMGGSGVNGRNPAGEGLTRDFNGEAIGAAGDDIFSMMNRRYKMKTTQDAFINN